MKKNYIRGSMPQMPVELLDNLTKLSIYKAQEGMQAGGQRSR